MESVRKRIQLLQLTDNSTSKQIKPIEQSKIKSKQQKDAIKKAIEVRGKSGKHMNVKQQKKTSTPSKDDPLYKFYTSLIAQCPGSKMAYDWCVKHGLTDYAEQCRQINVNKNNKAKKTTK